jgi:adenine C2-methylase RlmN of 23S rRNA A2503 and tRNA A37
LADPNNSVLPLTFHWPFIDNSDNKLGEKYLGNSNSDEVQKMVTIINDFKFKNVRYNLVRFNPPANKPYTEPKIEKLNELFKILTNITTEPVNPEFNRSRIIERVGLNVFASCGTFIDDHSL